MIDKNLYIDDVLLKQLTFNCNKMLTKEHRKQGKGYFVDDLVNESIIQYLTAVKDDRILDLQSRKDPRTAISKYIRGIALMIWIDKRKPLSKEIWKNFKEDTFEKEDVIEYGHNEYMKNKEKLFNTIDESDVFHRTLINEWAKSKNMVELEKSLKINRKRLKKYIKIIIEDLKSKM